MTRNGKKTTFDAAWDKLLELGVSEDTLIVITTICGARLETLEDVLFVKTGYRTFEQLQNA